MWFELKQGNGKKELKGQTLNKNSNFLMNNTFLFFPIPKTSVNKAHP